MDGHPLTVAEVERIADLESREVLLAKLAGAMKGNLAKAAGLFNAPGVADGPAAGRAAGEEGFRASSCAAPAAAAAEPAAAAPAAEPAAEAPAEASGLKPTQPNNTVTRKTLKPQKSGRTHTMPKLSSDELLDAFKEMTLLELSDFVKKFEDTFEVTAAAPVAVAAAGAGRGAARRRGRRGAVRVRRHPRGRR